MLTLNDGRSELWQWDTGRTLAVDADCSQVHFSNKVFGRSIDVDVVDGVATIPDILLQTDKNLNAWAFVGTPENGYTKISKVFKVNRRNKPADYVFTLPEQTTLEEIMERLDDLEAIQDPDAIKNAVEDYLSENPPKGEKGDKGDPGNDYILTDADKEEIAEMAADLVDVPEGSGGIAVTGATVGQTVKISAVDENGVPTAWEPVDMPIGEKAWKLIRTVVLEEDAQRIIITTDSEGNPFEYDELAIKSVTMEGDDGKQAYTGAIWVNEGVESVDIKRCLYYDFLARHVHGFFSPVLAYLRPFCGGFAFSAWYHDSGVSAEIFRASAPENYDAALALFNPMGVSGPTVMNTAAHQNSKHMVHSPVKASKITAFSYGAPYVDHLMAQGSVFEFYGR